MNWVFHAYSEMYGVALMGSRRRAAPLNRERMQAPPDREPPRADRRRLGVLGALLLEFLPRSGGTISGRPPRR